MPCRRRLSSVAICHIGRSSEAGYILERAKLTFWINLGSPDIKASWLIGRHFLVPEAYASGAVFGTSEMRASVPEMTKNRVRRSADKGNDEMKAHDANMSGLATDKRVADTSVGLARRKVALLIGAGLTAGLLAAPQRAQAWHSTDMLGTLPKLSFTMTRATDGKEVNAADYKGKVTLLYSAANHADDASRGHRCHSRMQRWSSVRTLACAIACDFDVRPAVKRSTPRSRSLFRARG